MLVHQVECLVEWAVWAVWEEWVAWECNPSL
jgi:hypothetical protein